MLIAFEKRIIASPMTFEIKTQTSNLVRMTRF